MRALFSLSTCTFILESLQPMYTHIVVNCENVKQRTIFFHYFRSLQSRYINYPCKSAIEYNVKILMEYMYVNNILKKSPNQVDLLLKIFIVYRDNIFESPSLQIKRPVQEEEIRTKKG